MPKFGVLVKLGPYEQMARDVILAERSGLDSIWIPDHLVVEDYGDLCPETWCTLSALATCTEKVTLGTSVTDPYRRHPAVLAQTVATLDRISRGRAVLGLGAGEAMNVEPFGIPWDRRISRMKETVEVLRILWGGEIVDYEGEVFRMSKAFVQVPSIRKPSPPIYLAANSPKTRRLVGVYANGWLAEMMSPERYASDIKEVGTAARNAGRDISNIDVTCNVTTAVSKDSDEARRAALLKAKRRFLWWPKQLETYGYNVTGQFDWNNLIIDKDTAKMIGEHISDVPDEPCEKVTIFGTPEDCIDKIEKYVKVGVNRFTFEIESPYEETCEIIRSKIIPYFEGNE
jgi:alkanesulfonate monooxygenase SsuD/methylene tetrahydromethanopterin reductase-like flavin-dependent oxidoreductase (luciferase family)